MKLSKLEMTIPGKTVGDGEQKKPGNQSRASFMVIQLER